MNSDTPASSPAIEDSPLDIAGTNQNTVEVN